jgi:RimJ/RimL family protein N-acetyltransferase
MILQEGKTKIVSTVSDDPDLKELAQDFSILENLSETRLYPPNMPSSMVFRIEHENKLIGEIGFRTIKWFNRKAEITLFISPEDQGKGHGKQALLMLMKFAFEKMNLVRLEAEVIDYNDKAKSLFEKVGFILEGRLRAAKYNNGNYYDVLRYGMLKDEYDKKHKSG